MQTQNATLSNKKTNILVYGAGVIGCELAHVLIRAGNEVTLLARGKWKEALEQNGIIIRHYAQLYTTKDRVRLIEKLEPDDVYDIIFVVMQYCQLEAVLPVLALNKSRGIVLIGNNPEAGTALEILTRNDSKRQVAFGFLGVGGRRENGRVISVHAGVGLTLGALKGTLGGELRRLLETALEGAKCHVKWEDDMDAWLKLHIALIMPAAYVCYAVGCDMTKASRAQFKAILDAALEACLMLKTLMPINEAESVDYYKPGKKRRAVERLLIVLAKTPIGRLAVSDHCGNAVEEMRAIDEAYGRLIAKTGAQMPAWDRLRSEGNPADYPVKQKQAGAL